MCEDSQQFVREMTNTTLTKFRQIGLLPITSSDCTCLANIFVRYRATIMAGAYPCGQRRRPVLGVWRAGSPDQCVGLSYQHRGGNIPWTPRYGVFAHFPGEQPCTLFRIPRSVCQGARAEQPGLLFCLAEKYKSKLTIGVLPLSPLTRRRVLCCFVLELTPPNTRYHWHHVVLTMCTIEEKCRDHDFLDSRLLTDLWDEL